jgi:hypothetical protein
VSEKKENGVESMSYDANTDGLKEIVVFASKYEDTSPRIIRIALTEIGMVMYFFTNAELESTVTLTYDEWFEFSQRNL